jgi:hypothetical protein
MPDEFGVKITGLQEAIADLSRYNNFQAAGALTKGLNAAGDVLFNEVARKTPVRALTEATGGLVSPGDLRNSLKKEVILSNDLTGGSISIWHNGYGWLVGWLEYGHKMIGHKPEKRQLYGPRTPEGFVVPGGVERAYPFMRTAVDEVGEQAISAFVEAINDVMDRIEGVGTQAA